MGTRHLITIVKDGEFKLAQYGQWDGYPSGQGAEILKFLSEGDMEALRRNVDNLYYIGEEEAEELYEVAAGIPKGQEWINMEQSDSLKANLPTLHRDTGAKILELLAAGGGNTIPGRDDDDVRIPTVNMLSFAGGWDCEWAYTIDLDKDTFEIYKAGSNRRLRNRFTDVIDNAYKDAEDKPCFVKLVGEYKFDALPTFEEFLEEQEPGALERHREWMARRAAAEAEEQGDTLSDENAPDDDGKPSLSM